MRDTPRRQHPAIGHPSSHLTAVIEENALTTAVNKKYGPPFSCLRVEVELPGELQTLHRVWYTQHNSFLVRSVNVFGTQCHLNTVQPP